MFTPFIHDVAASFPSWLDLLLDLNPSLSEQELEDEAWELARNYESCPHLGNVYQDVVLNHLNNIIRSRYHELHIYPWFYINALASSFVIEIGNGDICFQIHSKDDFFKAISYAEEIQQANLDDEALAA